MTASPIPAKRPRYTPNLRCADCRLHKSLCICTQMPSLPTRTRLVLLLHELEDHKPTNTGRLAVRCLPNSEIATRGHSSAAAIPDWLSRAQHPVVLFPHPLARPLADFRALDGPVTLIVPDGTWRQAKRARQRVAGLEAVPFAILPPGAPSIFLLRHDPRPGHLCTIEAIARAMGILESPAVEDQLMHMLRIAQDRTLWSGGRLPTAQVTGGIPDGVRPHDPLQLGTPRLPSLL